MSEEAPPGFEPGMADLQSAALGHLATAPELGLLSLSVEQLPILRARFVLIVIGANLTVK